MSASNLLKWILGIFAVLFTSGAIGWASSVESKLNDIPDKESIAVIREDVRYLRDRVDNLFQLQLDAQKGND